jgi:hypothetical protein
MNFELDSIDKKVKVFDKTLTCCVALRVIFLKRECTCMLSRDENNFFVASSFAPGTSLITLLRLLTSIPDTKYTASTSVG